MSQVFSNEALKGKTAFIAGGTSGINLGIAEAMAARGANLVVLSRRQEKVDAAVKTLSDIGARAMGFAADVRDYDAVEEAMRKSHEAFGELHCVVSGAAGNFLAPAVGLSAKGFKTVVDIDLLGTYNVFRASFDYLHKPGPAQTGASLIAITAGQAVHPSPMQIHACAAKAGVNMVVKCLALEWGPAGVRVNGISPGPIADTEGMERLAPNAGMEVAIKRRIALRSYGQKSEVADVATFLASDASRYVTGSIYTVDGGSELGDASRDCLSVPDRA